MLAFFYLLLGSSSAIVFPLQGAVLHTKSLFLPGIHKFLALQMQYHHGTISLFSCAYTGGRGSISSSQRSAPWTLPVRSIAPSQSPNWLKQNKGWKQVHPKWPLYADPSCSPYTGLSELSMSRMIRQYGVLFYL